MKIWRAFGSGHSAQLTVVGEFKSVADATLIQQAMEDYVNAEFEKRYPNLKAFLDAWSDRIPGIQYLGPTDFELAIDDTIDVERQGTRVTVSRIRSNVIGGMIQLMLMKEPTEVKVTGRTGP